MYELGRVFEGNGDLFILLPKATHESTHENTPVCVLFESTELIGQKRFLKSWEA